MLVGLDVGGTKITDAGAKTLAKSKSLEVGQRVRHEGHRRRSDRASGGASGTAAAYAVSTPLTDASLEALAKAPKLNSLWVADNKFTEEGLKKFKEARPKVTVFK